MLEDAESADEQTAAAIKANLAAAYYQRGMAKLGDGDLGGAEEDFGRSTEAAENGYAQHGPGPRRRRARRHERRGGPCSTR